MTNEDAVQNIRIKNVELRLDKHDEMLEKMANAQTEMMVSIAKLHASVKVLLFLLSASLGMDFLGAI